MKAFATRSFTMATPAFLASAIIVAVYFALAVQQSGDPLVIDEMEFPRLAEGIAETGRPVYYRGEQNPENTGIWHPPLYAYSLGLWVTLTGFSVPAVRLFGVLLMLGTAWLGVRIVRRLNVGGQWGAPTFLGLLLLHPYVIQSALLPDIDSTMLVFSIMVVSHEVVRLVTTPERFNRRVVTLGLAVGLGLASKLTSVPVLGVIFVGTLFVLGVGRATVATIGAFAIGTTAFLAWWGGLSAATGVSFAFPFTFIIESGTKGGISDRSLTDIVDLLEPSKLSVFWIGVLLPILMLWGAFVVFRHWKSEPESRVLIAFLLWATGIYALNSVLTGPPFSFPKYFITGFPAMAIVAAAPARYLSRIADLGRRGWIIVAVGFASLTWVSHWRFTQGADDAMAFNVRGRFQVAREYYLPGVGTLIVMIGAILVIIWIARGARRREVLGTAGIGFLAVAASLTAFNLSVDLYQRNQDEATRYFPGEVGFDETVDRMRLLVEPGELILAPKDIGSAVTNLYHAEEVLFNDLDALAAVVADPEVEYAVVRTGWDYSYLIFPDAQPVIENRMVVLEQVGDFLIYQRR